MLRTPVRFLTKDRVRPLSCATLKWHVRAARAVRPMYKTAIGLIIKNTNYQLRPSAICYGRGVARRAAEHHAARAGQREPHAFVRCRIMLRSPRHPAPAVLPKTK